MNIMKDKGETRFPTHRHRAQSIIQWNSLDQLEEEAIKGLYENVDYGKGTLKKLVCCEIIYGYVWWTCLQIVTSHFSHPLIFIPTSIPTLVSFLLIASSILLSCLLIYQPIICSPTVLLVSRLLTVLPLITFNNPTGPLLRLLIICVGGAATVLAAVGNWWNMSTIDRHRKTFFHIFGLLLMVAMKLWLGYFNPLLTGTYLRSAGIIIIIIVIIILFINDERTPPLDNEKSTNPLPQRDSHLWVWLGVGFGCHMFIIQLLYIDAATLPGWSGITRITLWPCLVVLCLCIGVTSGVERNIHFLASHQWLIVALINLFIFYYGHTFYSFIGGLILTVHISGVWPLLCVIINEPLSIFIGFGVYMFLIKIGCYELLWLPVSQWLLLPTVITQWIALQKWVEFAIQTGKIKRLTEQTTSTKKGSRRGSYITVLGHVIRRLSTVSEMEDEEEDSGEETERNCVHIERVQQLLLSETFEIKVFNKTRLVQVSMVLCVIALLGSAYSHPLLYNTSTKIDSIVNITVLSLNAGYDVNGGYNDDKISQIITHTDSNVVCLFDVSEEFTGGGLTHVNMIGQHVAMTPYFSQQRNPRLAILTNIKVTSSQLSDREGVILTLESLHATPVTVACHNSEPQIEPDVNNNIIISRQRILNNFQLVEYDDFKQNGNNCHRSYVYYNGLEKVANSCVTMTNVNVTTLSMKLI